MSQVLILFVKFINIFQVNKLSLKSFVAAVPYEGHPYHNRTRFFDIAGEEDYPTKAADLQLIAAAPDLYATLERFLAYWETDFIKVTAEDGRTLAEQMSKMGAALKKARGEQ